MPPEETLSPAARQELLSIARRVVEAAARQEEAGRLRTTLATLPARQQEVVWLRFRGGLSYREIAEVCATSAGNVGVMLHTAIKTLRGRLAEAPVPLGSKEVT